MVEEHSCSTHWPSKNIVLHLQTAPTNLLCGFDSACHGPHGIHHVLSATALKILAIDLEAAS